VFIGEILANMTQVSDVAPGPLVERIAGNAGAFPKLIFISFFKQFTVCVIVSMHLDQTLTAVYNKLEHSLQVSVDIYSVQEIILITGSLY
jgi:hypothetical protein